jgi:hypothetical protein
MTEQPCPVEQFVQVLEVNSNNLMKKMLKYTLFQGMQTFRWACCKKDAIRTGTIVDLKKKIPELSLVKGLKAIPSFLINHLHDVLHM